MSRGVAGLRRAATVLPTALCFAFALLPSAALGADDNRIIYPSGTPHATAPSVSGSGAANTVTVVVALVIAGVGIWMMWRKRNAGMASSGLNRLAVEETKSLGNRQYLVVASYEGKKFLLGVCPGRIDLLAPLNDDRQRGPT